MKRINPKTKIEFKHGDVREDGFIFGKYILNNLKKDGYFAEQWYSPKSFQNILVKKAATKKLNRDKYNSYDRKWAKNNRPKRNALQAKRKADKLLRTPKWLTLDDLYEIVKLYKLAREKSVFLNIPHHVDHIVPLCGEFVSGLHVPWNLQIITAEENMKKGNFHVV